MSQVWLIVIESTSRTYKYDTEKDALSFLGKIITGEQAGIVIQKMYKVDPVAGTMTEVEVVLENYRLVLRERSSV